MANQYFESLNNIKMMFGTDVVYWRLPRDSNGLELGPTATTPTTVVALQKDQAARLREMGGETTSVSLDLVIYGESYRMQLLGKKIAGVMWSGSATPIDKRVANIDPLVTALSFAELVISEVNCVVAIIDCEGHIQRFNRLAEELTGMRERDVIGKSAFQLLMSEEDGRASSDRVADFFKTGETYDVERTLNTLKGPRLFQLRCKFLPAPEQSGKTFLVCSGIDITEERAIHKRLAHLANSDQLTGLGNRNHLTAVIAKAIAEENAIGRLSLLFIDLNNFKRINDSIGHQYGDQLLKKVALRMQQVVCGAHEITRVSGDEFVIVVTGDDAASKAAKLADEIISELDFSFTLHANNYKVRASIGLADHTDFGDSEYDLLKRADLAMYQAKAMGRRNDISTVYAYNEELSSRTEREWEKHQALHSGFVNKEFGIDYRVFRKLNGDYCGAGVTAIWNRPGVGLVDGDEFLPIVEASAFGIQMGEFVLREIAIQSQEKVRPEFQLDRTYVVVTVPEAQLLDGDLDGFIRECARDYCLDPVCLYLVMPPIFDKAPSQDLVDKLHAIRRLGAKVMLKISTDSFFPNLLALPCDGIIMDREFTARVPADVTVCAIAKALIGLCTDTGRMVLVEGIVDKDQFKWFSQFPDINFEGPATVPPLSAGASATS